MKLSKFSGYTNREAEDDDLILENDVSKDETADVNTDMTFQNIGENKKDSLKSANLESQVRWKTNYYQKLEFKYICRIWEIECDCGLEDFLVDADVLEWELVMKSGRNKKTSKQNKIKYLL